MSYRPWILVLAAALAAGCETAPRVPTTFQKVAGDVQTATVGTAVSVAPSVRVLDQDGEPLSGATVVFRVTAGGGTVAMPTALTNASGVATPVQWTLGTTAGENGLTASLEGLPDVPFEATGTPDVPASISVSRGADQSARVAEALPVAPAVLVTDRYGNPTPDVEVAFRVAAGDGELAAPAQRTDAQGVAAVGAWTLGRLVGENRLDAETEGVAPISIVAVATAGAPVAALKHLGDGQRAAVTTDVPLRPSVRVIDTYGNPVAGVLVSFVTSDEGAAVDPASVTTDDSGVAAVARWKLGTVAGSQSLTASADGLPAVTLTATAAAGAAASMAVADGADQTGTAGVEVEVPPAVVVHDAWGNPTPGVDVTFVVLEGNGSALGSARQTDADGVAAVGAWILGEEPGANALEARVDGVAPVRFAATGTESPDEGPDGTFSITLRFGSGLSASQQAIFEEAVERWEDVITGDLPGFPMSLDADLCGTHPAINEIVDDLLIHASAVAIDGESKVLGRAGPCVIRSEGFLPILGFMEFDTADMDALEAQGRLLAVILHEIGHVLGIGTIWDRLSLLSGAGTSDPWFTGDEARSGFDDAGGSTYVGRKVPVEGTGGSGTRDSHWRESVLDNELMTGFLDSGSNPMSAITIGSLLDLGYEVDFSEAQPYSFLPALRAPGEAADGIQLIELPLPTPGTVGPNGEMLRMPVPPGR